MSAPAEEFIMTRSSPTTKRNRFFTNCTKPRLMAFVFIAWVFLLQIANLSFFSGAIVTYNNQSSSFAANPPTRKGSSILDDDNKTLSAPPRASANVVNDTPIGEKTQSLPLPSAGLRLDWTQLDLHSSMAKRIAAHQSSCDLPEAIFPWRNVAGMGSDFTLWSYAMCKGLQLGQRLISPRPWIHWSQLSCPSNDSSAMTCYFPQSEDFCPRPDEQPVAKKDDNTSHPPRSQLRIQPDGRVRDECRSTLQQANLTIKDFVGSATEFLFSSLSPRVVDSAVERLPLVFPPHGIVPPNLITVHIRWGDKAREMHLVDIHSYIDACHQILQRRRDQVTGSQGTNKTNLANSAAIYTNNSGSSQDEDPVHIYLATEDPTAIQAMRENMPSHWNLYVDPYVNEFSQYRQTSFNGNAKMTKAHRGAPALSGLASLLIAMEANDFVLTTRSNWSRLMNDIRRFIVQHHFATTVIDLRHN